MENTQTDTCKPTLGDISLAIVCPMANERDTVEEFVASVLEACTGFRTVTFFAIIDNVSTDGTLDILKNMQTTKPELNVVWAPENKCVVDAYMRGYKEAISHSSDWILEIDAGFSHQPSDIPKFFDQMVQGYDCVFGSRFCKGGSMSESPLARRILSRGGTALANLLLGTKLSDMTSGFELFTRETLQMILERGVRSHAHFFQTEIKSYCRKLNIAQVPIQYRAPSTNVNSGVLKDAFCNLFRLVMLRLTGNL